MVSLVVATGIMNPRSESTPQAKPLSAVFRYGFLGLCILLLALSVVGFATLPPDYSSDPYSGLVVTLMLLLNHLAYQFTLPRLVTLVLRVLSWVWTPFTIFYLLYWSHHLFPR